MPLKAVLMALSVAVIWGVNMLTVKGAVGEIPPLMLFAGLGSDCRCGFGSPV